MLVRTGGPRSDPGNLGDALRDGKKVRPDATGLLMEDHRTVLGWFRWYEAAHDRGQQRRIVIQVCLALRAHTTAEEDCFYPAARKLVGDDGLVAEAEKEHAEAKAMIERLEADPGGEEEAELMRTLGAAILHHVREEEARLFPAVRKAHMDVYAVGADVAARRVEALMDLNASRRAA